MHPTYTVLAHTFLLAALAAICPKASIAQATLPGALKLLGKYTVPYNMAYAGTTVGGLSGIDYDPKTNRYYLISDDRSTVNPARFYTAVINISPTGIDTVAFTKVTTFKQRNGTVYPNSKQDAAHTPDPEAIRYNPMAQHLVWSSEGERILKKGDTLLENPTVTIADTNGQLIDTLPLPPQLRMQANEYGPRQNGVFEGLAYADHYKTLFVSVEEPLYQDGPRAGIKDTTALVRILSYNLTAKQLQAQYAYKLDPVAYPPITTGAFMINGVADILHAGNGQLLVMERSFSTGRMACSIRIYVTDVGKAQNIANIPSLRQTPPVKPLEKHLLLNLDALGIYIDNVEGMTFGPTLPNGDKTLLMVADNNFLPIQQSQFLLFEVVP